MIDSAPAAGAGERPDTAVLTQLADCMRRLAGLAGIASFLEDTHGRLLAHHLVNPDVSPLLVHVVVQGTTQHLHAHVRQRRATGLLLGYPLIEASLQDHTVVVLPLPVGALVLVTDRAVALTRLQEPVERLLQLTALTAREPEASCLAGGALPRELAGCERFWVARLDAVASADVILAALPLGARQVVLSGVEADERAYAVLGGQADLGERDAERSIARVHRELQQRLGQRVTVALSEGGSSAELPRARTQADLGITAVAQGGCRPLSDLRARLALTSLAGALPAAGELGRDPLDELLEYDRQKHGALAASLLAWLNSFGDSKRAADVVGVHVNTLRYRLNRAEELLGINLREDQDSRALVHLQLLTATALP
ncbi:MAG: transcriptional regulator [Frankiales bacterium]|nr:transcriptional regulator [Frankiales bacterium]